MKFFWHKDSKEDKLFCGHSVVVELCSEIVTIEVEVKLCDCKVKLKLFLKVNKKYFRL